MDNRKSEDSLPEVARKVEIQYALCLAGYSPSMQLR